MARLKPPFVLSVQGDVVRQLSRIGKPVGPLPFLDAEATVWVLEGGVPSKKIHEFRADLPGSQGCPLRATSSGIDRGIARFGKHLPKKR